ncbi:30S ribosomal protein S9 [Kamptonema cortianum]|nr:30S ribosomal protein S9 [Oscillatoria laete-virens]MDK3157127.1 30S ribosomal protein S9 [Kamptonema cortianum]MDL5051103.1 30S ribosomal protein S9 [Oscillatoria amoena NRMC-F 0135]MDL5055011.1 30S ribosomal protein S9 [Oscillatoria laete-virens NRMC-F 0139]
MATTQSPATVGRRKEASASVVLKPGSGKIEVNGREFETYFPTLSLQNQILNPFIVTETTKKFDVKVNAKGGGITGQAGAVRHAIARALCEQDANLRPVLKKAGFLTRDPRMKERKKSGQPGARRRFQFSKR